MSILHMHQLGKGAGDILCGWHGIDQMVEIKVPGGTLTTDEERFHRTWRGSPILIAETAEQVIRHMANRVSLSRT